MSKGGFQWKLGEVNARILDAANTIAEESARLARMQKIFEELKVPKGIQRFFTFGPNMSGGNILIPGAWGITFFREIGDASDNGWVYMAWVSPCWSNERGEWEVVPQSFSYTVDLSEAIRVARDSYKKVLAIGPPPSGESKT